MKVSSISRPAQAARPRPRVVREGPRERLERAGALAVSDEELIAVVLGHGSAATPAEALAHALLARAGGVHGLTRMTRDEMRQTRGLGDAQAARIQAAIELGRRTLARQAPERPQFTEPAALAAYLLPRFGAFPVERFGLLLLDSRHRLLRAHIHSVGALDASLAHPRDIFRVAVGGGAAKLILFHNHPSGDPAPSRADVKLTLRLAQAGQVIGVPVLDHLILADAGYFSFRLAGLLGQSE